MSLKLSENNNFLYLHLPYNTPLLSKQYENDYFEIYKIKLDSLSTFLTIHNIKETFLPFSDILIYKNTILLSTPFNLILVNKNAPFIKIATNYIKLFNYNSFDLFQPNYISDNYINLGLVFNSLNNTTLNNYCVIDKKMLLNEKRNDIMNIAEEYNIQLKSNKYNMIYIKNQLIPIINLKKINEIIIEKFDNDNDNENNIKDLDKKSISGKYVELTTSNKPWFGENWNNETNNQIFLGKNNNIENVVNYTNKISNDKYPNFMSAIRTHLLETNFKMKPFDIVEYFGINTKNEYNILYVLIICVIIACILYIIIVKTNLFYSNNIKQISTIKTN